MLISIKINNVLIFNNESEFSLRADGRARRLRCNVSDSAGEHLVKAAILLGPNNSGKTNFIRIVSIIKSILLNNPREKIQPNFFSKNPFCELSVCFTQKDKEYSFACRFDAASSEYTREVFSLIRDGRESILIQRDSEKNIFQSDDTTLVNAMRTAGKNNLLIFLLDTKQFPSLASMKDILVSFASSIDVIDMNNIPIQKTLQLLKQPGEMQRHIADFVKNADLSLEGFGYASEEKFAEILPFIKVESEAEMPRAREEVLNVPSQIMDMLHLQSVYNGVSVPSIFFDSAGTKKFAALAGYILQALKDERILVVDELDNGLHFRLTRTILALFNNELNHRAQIIATVHDIALLDCKKLFRKDQIWFTSKDKKQAYLYSLSEFTAREDGVRETSDLMEKYRSGIFGALPEPELFDSLLELNNAKA